MGDFYESRVRMGESRVLRMCDSREFVRAIKVTVSNR